MVGVDGQRRLDPANPEVQVFNPDFEKQARDTLLQIQNDEGNARQYWQELKRASMKSAYEIYGRLNVLLTEHDERGESAYRDTLAETVRELDGAGLVVEDQGARCIFMDGFLAKDGTDLPLIIQKTDGSFLYATTDLAAIRHRVRILHADRIVYVTDARQKLHFQMLFAAADKAGWLQAGGRKVCVEHVIFGTVLGADNKPLKTRTGENVRLKDLLDEAVERGTTLARQNEADPENRGRTPPHGQCARGGPHGQHWRLLPRDSHPPLSHEAGRNPNRRR